MSGQREQVEKFRSLHAQGRLLLLPNAWDAASARLAEEAGAEAIATSSAALAWSNGYADGETMTREVILASARAILRVVHLPVSVDSEAGYSPDPAKVADHVAALIDLGVAGINLEDGRDPPDLLAAKIRAIKAMARARDADIFINARCDVYLRNLADGEAGLKETLRRGKLYAEAGADGFFVPALNDLAGIREVVKTVSLPVNILVMRATPPLAELKAAGVRRVSAGALIGRAAYGAAQKAVTMLLKEGKPDAIFATSGDCPEFNRLFG